MPRDAGWSMDRRTFLSASAATVGVAYLGGCSGGGLKTADPEPEPVDGAQLTDFSPEQVALDEARYPLGVQAGAMTADSALLWTHVAASDLGVLRVWRPSEVPGQVKLVKELPVSATEGFAKVSVDGLGAGFYHYAFFDEALSVRSPIGRFRTAFAQDDLRPLTIGSIACTNLERAPFGSLEVLAEMQPDLLCHLGDLSYNDAATTRQEYRDIYRQTLQDPGYKAVLPTAGMYPTWDDHEVGNDFNPEQLAAEDPELLQTATDAYFEHVAVPEAAPRRLWHSYTWGATAEIFVLDCRGERKPSTRSSEAPVYISEAQFQWLLDGLQNSTAHFKVIMSSVPITRLFGLWDLAINDRWEGYGEQRARLMTHLQSNVQGRVLFLAGDFHCGYIGRVEPEGPGSEIWEVCTSTGARAPNPVAVLYDTGNLTPEESFPPGQFIFGTGNTRNATTVTLDPLNDLIEVKFVDGRADTRDTVLFDGQIPLL